MNNAIYHFREPQNEPVLNYKKGSEERKQLMDALNKVASEKVEIPLIIGGKEIKTGIKGKVVMPHSYRHVLAEYHMAQPEHVKMAIEAALKAKTDWMELSWIERASIFQRAAELVSKKYRYLLNATTMHGQGKNAFQAEIDSACEVIDYLRFNNHFASKIYEDQPIAQNDVINRVEYRPLEGFIYSISPFNFTAIAANLNASVALMGNVLVWKPSTTALLSNYLLMKIFKEAGLPDGVINFIPGKGSLISDVVLNHKDFAGIHFTGSTKTFRGLWSQINENLEQYRSYPKIVGETGGKDFVFVHHSANVDEVTTALIRGAFEYQGQKCSAASRAYIPQSLWPDIKNKLLTELASVKWGSVDDLDNFMNAVIDKEAYERIMNYINKAKSSNEATILFGGKGDDSVGYFIEPTVIQAHNPHFITMEEEIFGPVLTIYIYPDEKYEETLKLCDATSPYALTGSIFSYDRYATIKACRILRYAAGNLYFNDKPTGAMVGQQPFGGSRGSGTNDKAGSHLNLLRWVSPRTIKETLVPPQDYRYDYMK
ncbi:MAG TPA: L-glutamate gamma-semialdehyde dehydrogenase [Bacteroidales bacterium]|nr:L-glutamate gamma-semialdehyde dehydrogenase [Bacteroidales bacterium]